MLCFTLTPIISALYTLIPNIPPAQPPSAPASSCILGADPIPIQCAVSRCVIAHTRCSRRFLLRSFLSNLILTSSNQPQHDSPSSATGPTSLNSKASARSSAWTRSSWPAHREEVRETVGSADLMRCVCVFSFLIFDSWRCPRVSPSRLGMILWWVEGVRVREE